MLYLMLWLGNWQWEKGEYREYLEQTVQHRKDLEPTELHLLPAAAEARKYLPVVLTGRFDDRHQFLHDNRIVRGRSGYNVYTPFITDTNKVLLVNRGWLPTGRTRQEIPDIDVSTEQTTIYGLVDSYPEKGFVLSDNAHQGTTWPLVLQYLDHEETGAISGYDLLDMIVWMKPDTEHGYYREYPSVDLDSAKNTGYAFQWFAMSFALCVIYIVVNTRKIRTYD